MEDKRRDLSTEETEKNIKARNESVDTLDALLLDADNDDSKGGKPVDDIQFADFMADYRNVVSKNLADAKKSKKVAEDGKELSKSEKKNDAHSSLSKNKKKALETKTDSKSSDDWSEDIRLTPEEYTDLKEESAIEVVEEKPAEESYPEFDLGDSAEEKSDDFQISINFDGEELIHPDTEHDDEKPEKSYNPDKPRAIDWAFDIAEMFAFVLAIVMILTAFVFKHSVVEGSSMMSTLADGDHLIISDLFYTPKRGDIIVFEDYSTSLRKAVVKRVIAVGGDTVEVRLNAENEVVVYVNGELVNEDYTVNTKDVDISTAGFNKPITLADDEIFVMGDNRYHSLDSRSPSVGPIKTDAVLGKVLFRFMPFEKFGAID